MKNHLNKILAVLAMLGATSQVNAYRYSFTNHTNKEIGVAMQYQGVGEPRYFRWIPAHQAREFAPGRMVAPGAPRGPIGAQGFIDESRVGYVLRDLWYVENPPTSLTTSTNHNDREIAKQLPWRAITITWVPSASYQKAIDLAESVGKTTEGAGKLALEAGAAYVTGGASVAAEAAGAAASKAASAATSGASAEAMKSAGANIGGLGLANLLKNVGQVAAESMMRDRHIDIVEDEKGKISFISLL